MENEIQVADLTKYCEKQKEKRCYICNCGGIITEVHHINPQKNKKEHLKYFGVYKSKLVNLCPNCHSYIHKFLNEKQKSKDFGYCIILAYWKEYLGDNEKIQKAQDVLVMMRGENNE